MNGGVVHDERESVLDLLSAPLEGVALVEASAGTGKTYTITGLLLRLVGEGRVEIDQLLVVTYTVAATAELRDRIRQALLDAVAAFETGESSDLLLQGMLARYEDQREAVLLRYAAAVANFDAVAIYTIHGFCQRALVDYAFEGGLPFALDMLLDDGDLLDEIVRDFWRQRLYDAPSTLVDFARSRRQTPATLARWVRAFVEKPFMEVQAPVQIDLEGAEQSFFDAYRRTRSSWLQSRDEVGELLLQSSDFNGRKYRRDWLGSWLAQLADYLSVEQARVAGFDKLEKFGRSSLAAGMKKGKAPPEHAFFALCEELSAARDLLRDRLEQRWQVLLADLLNYCNRQLEERKETRQQQSFSDLLLRLSAALGGRDGEHLAEALRRRYQAALIDEFQDTDPIQYHIFQRIYRRSGLPVYLVGDPKQAIYSFRGADVFTYLDGRSDAEHRFTLTHNWRSTPPMIAAVNALFSAHHNPFCFERIPFSPASPAPREHEPLLLEGRSDPAPFKFWLLDSRDDARDHSKSDAIELAAEATASEIARLLNGGQQGRVTLAGCGIGGGDIAVLVRSHGQALRIRAALAGRGIASVEQAQESVFDSVEAADLERVMAALVEPGSERLVRAALVTPLFGLDAAAIHALDDDDRAWEGWFTSFSHWHELWRERGFMVAMRRLIERHDVAGRLARHEDGHRRLTNLRHLLELLQVRAQSDHGMESLLQWLAGQRLDTTARGEASQLRLENDEQLVKIVTIHKSKGLQYPVVFCPFVWDGKLWSGERGETPAIHDPADDFRPRLDLRGSDEVRQIAQQEELAENLRLLYVALTRAEHRCYVAWGAISSAGSSALAWLLHPGAGADVDGRVDVDAHGEAFAALSDEQRRTRLERLSGQAHGAIAVASLSEQIDRTRYHETSGTRELRDARTFAGRSASPWRVTSYSALASHGRGRAVGEREAQRSAADAERRDYDGDALDQAAGSAATGESIHTFPRGARAGHCLHDIFERIDFGAASVEQTAVLVADSLRNFGFDADWQGVVGAMIEQVVHCGLGADGGPRLVDVAEHERLCEMAFHFPLAAISAAGLKRAVAAHENCAQQLAGLAFSRVQGFMKGFIDLVFQSGERFYIVDYKSNWLGERAADYHADALDAAMQQGDYHWQYLIYCVALHRYLRYRVPDYSYERHFGGVFYLFIRGMQADDTSSNGIYRARPEAGLIIALDHYFATGDGSPLQASTGGTAWTS